MGIDFGTKKVGIALSDASGTMAFPHSVIPNNSSLLKTITSLIEAEQVSDIIIGHSVNAEGQANTVHQMVEEFMTDLTLQLPIPIHLEPEQYTTQQAIKLQGRNEATDASAAALILESYLSKQRTGSVFDELND